MVGEFEVKALRARGDGAPDFHTRALRQRELTAPAVCRQSQGGAFFIGFTSVFPRPSRP
jgi:hypothetical protein